MIPRKNKFGQELEIEKKKKKKAFVESHELAHNIAPPNDGVFSQFLTCMRYIFT